MTLFLGGAGYNVVEAADGAAAVATLAATQAAAVVTDIVMPERDGFETIRELRRVKPGCPVIAVSGAGCAEEYLRIASVLGAEAVLLKPVEREELLRAVEGVLG